MEAWQPIATAPRDGTEILTFRGGESMAVAVCVSGWWVCTDGMGLLGVTHWMPLPKPPATIDAEVAAWEARQFAPAKIDEAA